MKIRVGNRILVGCLFFCSIIVSISLALSAFADDGIVLSLPCDEGTGLPQDYSGYGNNSTSMVASWDTKKQLATELTSLAPVLLQPEENILAVHSTDTANRLHLTARRTVDSLYLIAANSGEGTATFKFDLSAVKEAVGSNVTVLFESRNLSLDGRSCFQDSFSRYARHVYKLDCVPANLLDSPLITGSVGNFTAEKWRPFYTKQSVPNLLFNSSFEIATNPGWPDGWNKWCGFSPDTAAWFPRIGEIGANFTADTTTAYYGATSLRISTAGNQTQDNVSALQSAALPLTGVAENYVYSVYLKGDRANLSVKPRVQFESWNGMLESNVTVDTTWQRYYFYVNVPSFQDPVSRFPRGAGDALG